MPTDVTRTTGAAIEREIKGQTYRFSPIGFQAIGYLTRWMRDEIISSGRRAAAEVVEQHNDAIIQMIRAEVAKANPDKADHFAIRVKQVIDQFAKVERQQIIDTAFRHAQKASLFEDAGMMGDPAVILRLIHESVKVNHPDVSLGGLDRMFMGNLELLGEIANEVMIASGFKDEAVTTAVGGAKQDADSKSGPSDGAVASVGAEV